MRQKRENRREKRGQRVSPYFLLALLLFPLLLCSAVAQAERLPSHIWIGGGAGTVQTGDHYIPVSGSLAASSEPGAQIRVPVHGIFKELRCITNVTNDSDEAWTVTLRVNQANTALTCSIGVSAGSCTDLLNSVPVTTADEVNYLMDNTAGCAPSVLIRCSVVLYEYS